MPNIVYTPPVGWLECTGAHVAFKAPCSCDEATAVKIGSNTYTLVDANGVDILGANGTFTEGALIEAILDVEEAKAYLLTTSHRVDSIVEIGTSGIWTFRRYQSGLVECWGKMECTYDNGAMLICSEALPFVSPVEVEDIQATICWDSSENIADMRTVKCIVSGSQLECTVYSETNFVSEKTLGVYVSVKAKEVG